MSLFPAPADPTHASRSLWAPVDRHTIESTLRSERQYAALIQEIGQKMNVYCWAASAGKRGTFAKMARGDDVLFSIRGAGKFAAHGVIIAKLESLSFARRFWEDQKLMDWPYIYFLEYMRQIAVQKSTLAKCLGYDKNDRFQGLRSVPAERLGLFDSIVALLESVIAARDIV